jgi:hypothetical protein
MVVRRQTEGNKPEDEFLNEIQAKVILLALHRTTALP